MALRIVDIRIEGDYVGDIPSWIPNILLVVYQNWGKTMQGIFAALDSNGWIISDIADETGWTGNYVYRITAQVDEFYSDRQIQDQITRDLAGFFTVTAISILSAAWTGWVAPGQTQQPPANYSQLPPSNNPGGGNLPSIGTFDGGTVYGSDPNGGFLSSLGLGAGISTPIALIAGLIAVVLITRR